MTHKSTSNADRSCLYAALGMQPPEKKPLPFPRGALGAALPALQKKIQDLFVDFYEKWIHHIQTRSLDELLDGAFHLRDPIHDPHIFILGLERRKAYTTQETIFGMFMENMTEAVLSVRLGVGIKADRGPIDFNFVTSEVNGGQLRFLVSQKTSGNHSNKTGWAGFFDQVRGLLKPLNEDPYRRKLAKAVVVLSTAGRAAPSVSYIPKTKPPTPLYKLEGQATWFFLSEDPEFYIRLEEWKRPISDRYEPLVETAILAATDRHEKELLARYLVEGVMDVRGLIQDMSANLHLAKNGREELFHRLGLTW